MYTDNGLPVIREKAIDIRYLHPNSLKHRQGRFYFYELSEQLRFLNGIT